MRNKILSKYLIFFLAAAQFFGLPLFALAQAVPTCDPNTGSSCAAGYVAGITTNTGLTATLTAASTANLACAEIEQKYFNTTATKQIGFSGLSLIGGSGVQLAQYTADLIAIDGPPGDSTVPPLGFIPCRKFVLGLLDKVIAPNVYISNQKQTIYNAANTALANLKAREESIKAKQSNASQGFWKTLVFNILIKTAKSVSTSLLTKLVSNYKITNAKKYADSVATLMYDNQFLRDNFPGAQGQLMARAIMENPLFRYQIQPGIFVAADAALGFDPSNLNTNDPNYYAKMSTVGMANANPYFQHTQYVGGVDQARAASQSFSQAHIAQGNGYKAPVNCAGSLAQQKSIDGQAKAASDRMGDRKALLDNLQQAKALGQSVSDADLKKAQADYDAAFSAWNNLPFTVAGANSTGQSGANGGNNVEGQAAITICEAIVSPATLINKGVDQAFEAIGVNMKQYDNNNLPGYISMIGDVASQIGSSLIFGGTSAAKNALMMNESKLVNSTVGVAAEAAAAKTAENLAKGINFNAEKSGNSADSYTLNWDTLQVEEKLSAANFVTILGDGVPKTTASSAGQSQVAHLELSGSTEIHTTVGGTYTLTVFDKTGRALTQSTTEIKVVAPTAGSTSGSGSGSSGNNNPTNYVCGGQFPSESACEAEGNPASYCNAICGTVQGAFTSKPMLNIRGSQTPVSVRGQ